MRRLFVLAALLLDIVVLDSPLLAQTTGFCWFNQVGSAIDDNGSGVAILGSDHVVTTGTSDNKIFLNSYFHENGNIDLAEMYGGPLGGGEGLDVVTNGSTIYLVGRFSGSVTFDGFTLNSASGSEDVFIVCLDNTGNVSWAKRAGGTGQDVATGVAISSQDFDLLVSGFFSTNATFGPGENGETTLNSAGHTDAFVAKYDSGTGELIWAKRAGGSQNDRAWDITADEFGNSYIIGEPGETSAIFGQGELNETELTSLGFKDVFVAKYSHTGQLDWVRQLGGAGDERAGGIAIFVDENDSNFGRTHLYVTGGFTDTAFFGDEVLTSIGDRDIFVARYDDSGEVIWAKRVGGSGEDECRGVSLARRESPSGPQEVIAQVIGDFEGDLTFAAGEPGEMQLTSSGGRDVFIAKYADSGTFVWAKQAGGPEDDFGEDIAATSLPFNDGNGENEWVNGFIVGSYSQSAQFGTINRPSFGGTDGFASRIEDFSFPTNLVLEQVSDVQGGLSSYIRLSWDPPVNASAPVLSNSSSFAKQSYSACIFPDGSPGSEHSIQLQVTDMNGDVSPSSTVNLTTMPTPFGSSAIMSQGTLSITSGSVSFSACVKFGSAESVTLLISMRDDAGNLSNSVPVLLQNPDFPGQVEATGFSKESQPILQSSGHVPGSGGGAANLMSYNVYRQDILTGEEELIRTLPPEVTAFTDETTSPGSNYLYRVTAVYPNIESEHIADTLMAAASNPDKLFELVTDEAVVNEGGSTVSNSWGDYNNDNLPDLFVTNSAGGNNLLYKNNGDGSFEKMSSADVGVVVDDAGNSFSSTWGDFNNDGWIDLFVANFFFGIGQENALYLNQNGFFVKVLDGRVANDAQDSNSGTWADFDNDGYLDLFVANGGSQPQNNALYHNDGPPDYTFTKVDTSIVSNDGGRSIGAAWVDYDNDGDPDLSVANIGLNYLYRNNGDGSFTKITIGDFVTDDGRSMGVSWGDYDNDGDLDLFVANDQGPNFLYKSFLSETGSAIFLRVGTGEIPNDEASSFGSAWGDYDNDGDIDLFVANLNSNYLYENTNGMGGLSKISDGNNLVNNAGNSNGSAWADFNKDGFLDIFVANSHTIDNKNFLYVNNKAQGTNNNQFVNIRCFGTNSNRSSIGTKVRIKASIGGVSHWQTREISSLTGGGFGGQNNLNDVSFGLGDATKIDSIVINWPSGISVDTVNVLNLNQTYVFIEPVVVNSPPSATNDMETTPEDTEIVLDVLSNDSDPEMHFLSITAVSPATNGSLAINDGVNITYTPDLDFFGADSFDYYISDGNGGADTARVFITVSAQNDPPGAFSRTAPTDNSDIVGKLVAFSWTEAANVDPGDLIIYRLSITVPSASVDTVFLTIDTAVLVDFEEIGLDPYYQTVYWSVQATDGALNRNAENGVGILNLKTGVTEMVGAEVPSEYELLQNYPNPFNPATTIQYGLPEAQKVLLQVYDLTGRLVKTLVDGDQIAGRYRTRLDGSGMASGVYLYRLQAGDHVLIRKFVLMK